MFLCSECPVQRRIVDAKAYLAHFQFYHSKLVASRCMKCCHSDCLGRKYGKWDSFSKHVLSHRQKVVSSESPFQGLINENDLKQTGTFTDLQQDSTSNGAHSKTSNCCNVPSGSQNCDLPDTGFEEDQRKSTYFDNALVNAVVAFLANLYDCGHFNETQVQFIVDSHKQLLGSGFLAVLKDTVEKLLLKCVDSDVIQIGDVKNVSRMFTSCENMYEGFTSHYLRMSEIEKSGAYIPPEPFYIGHGTNEVVEDGITVIQPIELIGQFIPFRFVLKGFLELPNVLKSITDYMDELQANYQYGGPMSNIVQGTLWRKIIKPKFEGKCVIPLIFAFDDYETNKELGFHTCVHKMGAGYVKIGCLPPKFQSSLENLFLVLLFHSGDRKAGNDKVFRKVLNEFKFLEETGISIVTSLGTIQVFFALVLVIGDNLGANGILGFVECFVANHFCRVCFEHRSRMITQSETNILKRRTVESYESDLLINDVSRTGRKGPCVFNVLQSFHVSLNVHLDTMHDVDEGILKYTMSKVVLYLLKMKRCTLSYLNEMIQGFYYGSEEKNRPTSISHDDIFKNKKLRFSASEMKCFTRYFGLMVGHVIKSEDEDVWSLYLALRQYLDIVSAPIVSKADAVMLKHLCKEVCSKYQQVSGETLPPKFHLSQHDADLIEDNGPLEPLSCYRMEHKHKEGSDIAHLSQNRINLPLTITKNHQLKLAFRFLVSRGFVPKFHYSRVLSVPFESVQYSHYVKNVVPSDHKGLWHTCKWLEVNGARYELGSVVLNSLVNEEPEFGQIKVISIREEKAYLVIQCFNVVKFDDHFHAFEVTADCNNWLYVECGDLLSHLPTNVRHLVNGKSYIPFRFSVKCFKK